MHPDTWTKTTTLKWRDHIYAGQHGDISIRYRFQFYTLSEGLVDSDYRTLMHPGSSLRYDGSSRLWTARLLRQEDGDALARDELFFQLPLVPAPGECHPPWDEDELEDIYAHSLRFNPLLLLLDGVIKYERKGPIQVRVALSCNFLLPICSRRPLASGVGIGHSPCTSRQIFLAQMSSSMHSMAGGFQRVTFSLLEHLGWTIGP